MAGKILGRWGTRGSKEKFDLFKFFFFKHGVLQLSLLISHGYESLNVLAF